MELYCLRYKKVSYERALLSTTLTNIELFLDIKIFSDDLHSSE